MNWAIVYPFSIQWPGRSHSTYLRHDSCVQTIYKPASRLTLCVYICASISGGGAARRMRAHCSRRLASTAGSAKRVKLYPEMHAITKLVNAAKNARIDEISSNSPKLSNPSKLFRIFHSCRTWRNFVKFTKIVVASIFWTRVKIFVSQWNSQC